MHFPTADLPPLHPSGKDPLFLLLPFASSRFLYQTFSMPRGKLAVEKDRSEVFFPPSVLETMLAAWCSSSPSFPPSSARPP